jgi:hypothetical protein
MMRFKGSARIAAGIARISAGCATHALAILEG